MGKPGIKGATNQAPIEQLLFRSKHADVRGVPGRGAKSGGFWLVVVMMSPLITSPLAQVEVLAAGAVEVGRARRRPARWRR